MPSTEEQQQITDFLDKQCTEIDSLISQKETLLKDLELYKKSLIYECVTGKREVV
jgi:type I restriction enzyme S subunit